MHDLEPRIAHAALAAHVLQVLLPALAVGRVGEHEVEGLRRKGVVRQRRVFGPSYDAVGLAADPPPLKKHVSLADGIGLGVYLLAI